MVSKLTLDQVRNSNAAATWAHRPTAIFVGGTSGVGEALARAFAKASKGSAHIIIVGRSQARAHAIIESLPKAEDSRYDFLSCDVTDMKNIVTAAKAVKDDLSVTKLNYLALSQGGYPFGPADPCLNGIDRRLVLEFYSRWKFIDELLPLLSAAAGAGEEARVLDIKNPTQKQVIDVNDFGFLKNHSAFAQIKASCIYNNMMVEEYAKLYPKISFCHIFPGLVDTPGFDAAPFWMKPIIFIARLFLMMSAEESGQRLLFALLKPSFKSGAFYLDQFSEPAPAPIETQEAREALIEHYREEVATA